MGLLIDCPVRVLAHRCDHDVTAARQAQVNVTHRVPVRVGFRGDADGDLDRPV